eukprot:5786107-Amphidinium_carterae.1
MDCNGQIQLCLYAHPGLQTAQDKECQKRPTGFPATAEATSSSGVPPAGEATGGLFPWASAVLPGVPTR